MIHVLHVFILPLPEYSELSTNNEENVEYALQKFVYNAVIVTNIAFS